ncbi:hypothetical protein V757_02300 [Pelistega indica]|uniref:Uncharacterized protein n=1 Tax=Pelistega indica TaxID=1414851 RepID=V8G8N9_9BURK|nr:hypothetical protein [Pelistega indica]ETD72790.1 hypothetical protein V757_02300 [Pelistega indica]
MQNITIPKGYEYRGNAGPVEMYQNDKYSVGIDLVKDTTSYGKNLYSVANRYKQSMVPLDKAKRELAKFGFKNLVFKEVITSSITGHSIAYFTDADA